MRKLAVKNHHKHVFLLMASLLWFTGCVGLQVEVPLDFEPQQMEYVTALGASEAWKALLRFVSQNDFKFTRLESEKDIMEFTTGEKYDAGQESYVAAYHFILVGLTRGTKVVIDVVFYSAAGTEIEPVGYMKKTKHEQEQKMYENVKTFFQEEERK